MGGAAFLLAALLAWLVFGGGGSDSLAVLLLTFAAALLGVYDDLVALRRKRGAGASGRDGGRDAGVGVAMGAEPAVTDAPPHEGEETTPEGSSLASSPPTAPQRVAVRSSAAAAETSPTPEPNLNAPASTSANGSTDTTDATTGVLARYRLLIQAAAALVFALYAVRSGHELFGVPFLDLLGFAFIVVGSVNAFNFTDGLDGLAGGVAALVLLPFVGVGFVGALLGALLGFLWFNAHPARVFMGGVGSEALGAAVVGTAILAGWVWWLPLIALIPVLEVLSVIAQVGYFRTSGGKRLFKMSPLHHHFELSGWSEQQVVVRFWLLTAVCVALAWGLQGGFA